MKLRLRRKPKEPDQPPPDPAPEPEQELEPTYLPNWPAASDLPDSTAKVVETIDNAAYVRRDPATGRFTKRNGNDAA